MRIVPTNNYVLCKKTVSEESQVEEGKIFFDKKIFPEYQILDISSKLRTNMIQYNIGDVIVIDSIPTKVKMDECFYLVNADNIVGKIA